jgi:gas vesicle protein
MKTWLPISEAASKLGISDRALYYRIEKGKVESKVEAGNRFVRVEISENPSENTSEAVSETVAEAFEAVSESFQKLIEEKDARIGQLTNQVEHLQKQASQQETHIERLEQLLALEQKNVHTLAEQNQLLLADSRKKPSWWQRIVGIGKVTGTGQSP